MGCQLRFRYLAVKLLEYRQVWGELETSKNPFAVVVMAHLKMLETKKDIANRFLWKFEIVKSLLKHGFSKEIISGLFQFIDTLMYLPDEMEENFFEQVKEMEEERDMKNDKMLPIERAAYRYEKKWNITNFEKIYLPVL